LIGQHDSDLDNFFEWRSITTLGATDDEFETVQTEYSPMTRMPVRRMTVTPNAEVTHFVVEEMNTAGEWQVVEDYETPRIQSATLFGDQLPMGDGSSAPMQQDECEANPCNAPEIKKRMEEGVDSAAQCLPDLGQRGLDIYLASYNILSRRLSFRCAPIAGAPQATISGWDNPNGRLVVTVDPVKYCALNEEQRGWILYHEILHAALQSGHEPEIEALEEEHRKQLDRVYACMALCYNNKGRATKCMCAQCLGTVTCDPLCDPYNADCGATCPCPARSGQYYSACSTCLALCPSGLSCFGWSYCDPVGQSAVCPPQTCGAQ
jgi:hypothetical protein